MKKINQTKIFKGFLMILFVGFNLSPKSSVALAPVFQKADPLKGADIITENNGCGKNDILISKNIWIRAVAERRSRGATPTMELDRENATYCFINDVSLNDSTLSSFSLRPGDTFRMFTITRPGITVNMNSKSVRLPAHQLPSLPSVVAFYNPGSDHMTLKKGKIEGDWNGTLDKKGGIQVGYNSVLNDQTISEMEFNYLELPVVIFHSINVTIEQSNFYYYETGVSAFNSLVRAGTIDEINILNNNFYDGRFAAINTQRTPNDINIAGNHIQVNGANSIVASQSRGRLRIHNNEIFSSAGRKILIYILDSNEAFLEHNRLESNAYYPELTALRFYNTDEIGVWDNHFRFFHYGIDVSGTMPSAGANLTANGFCNVNVPYAVNTTSVNASQVPYWMLINHTNLNDCASW